MSAAVAQQQDNPLTRFRERQRRWRSWAQRIYPRHAAIEAHAPLLMGWLFDGAERVAGSVMREYHLTAEEPFFFVRLNGDARASKRWSWIAPSHDLAEGRGFYELWAFRFDMPVSDAAVEIWTIIRAGAPR